MKEFETEKFEKYGSFFFLLVLGLAIGLPFGGSLIVCLVSPPFRLDVFLPLAIALGFFIWIALLMFIAWG